MTLPFHDVTWTFRSAVERLQNDRDLAERQAQSTFVWRCARLRDGFGEVEWPGIEEAQQAFAEERNRTVHAAQREYDQKLAALQAEFLEEWIRVENRPR
ncbi:MAG: hypothetical protein F4052_06995 [Dehalococcoidia bacterium]|nr:hypothetical protein [Dehalococcoidia bacterium]MYK26678.1 hypothetical protein [Dehalococcoidia bacterium]